ncbi:MAG: pyridoxal 5'-phosphate synthase glutaminase subunit PdxT [Candidatus Obscuribacterales bacterium]|nr:pyridoxal 5'-phosphate synthase glutaminase subunit PdxT [Candidatus Obscuribacterales bacterium]
MSTLKIGVLALQGDFREHQHSVEQLGAVTVEIRHLRDLDRIDALIIPGGESTTINKFDEAFGGKVFATISDYGHKGMPIYGTCMGSIVLASRIEAMNQKSMGLMDITVRRNAYGPQRASFETLLDIKELGAEPFPAIFIRAPQIVEAGPAVSVLATIGDTIAMARQGRFLLTTFHPEITDDLRVHKYFLDIIRDNDTRQRPTPVTRLHNHANARPSLTLVGT